MSIRAIAWVFEQQNLAPLHKLVLVALADNASDTGMAYPSTETLTRKTSMSRRSVVRALDRLVEQRWIEDTGKRTGRSKQIKVYRIPAVDASAEKGVSWTPLKGANDAPKGVSQTPLRVSTGHPEPSEEPYKEPKRQLSELIEVLSEDPRFDGLDVEAEIARAVVWAEKKNRVVGARFLEHWLEHAEQPLEEDEQEELADAPYYSWEGWTEARRRALLELWPGHTLPPERWDKVSPDVKQQIEARVKEGWPA